MPGTAYFARAKSGSKIIGIRLLAQAHTLLLSFAVLGAVPSLVAQTSVTSAPIFNPRSGTFAVAQSVAITSASTGVSIYYSTDNSTPTTSSARYTGPITVSASQTIKAIAVNSGSTSSNVTTATYVIDSSLLGTIITVAGSGMAGFGGDGGPAIKALTYAPYGVAVDRNFNIYVADFGNNRVRKVTPDGFISTIAGVSSNGGFSGDGGLATSAQLNQPIDVAVDDLGNVFIVDANNDRIRKITAATGIITTIAGNGTRGYNGEGVATDSELSYPASIAIDSSGNVLIADYLNSRIRKVTTDGQISTIAGNGNGGFSGDGGPATNAQLQNANGVALDTSGTIYIGDGSSRVRKVDASGIITTIAGNGTNAYSGDGGPAVSAALSGTEGIAVDLSGNVYIAGLAVVRKVAPDGIISTVAGTDVAGYGGDGGLAIAAQENGCCGLASDSSGNFYIADLGNQRVRKVTFGLATPAYTPTIFPAGGTYVATQSVIIQDITPSATIYYTTDGSVPTAASTKYTSPISVSSTQTVNAIAVSGGYGSSAVASAAYQFQNQLNTTTITLSITSGGTTVSSVSAGAAVKLAAAVSSGGSVLTQGTVIFCNSAAIYCENAILGTAQITGTGSASITLIPGAGTHSYKAMFLGTRLAAASASDPVTLAVQATLPTQTILTSSGSIGDYTLSATVTGLGGALSPSGAVSFMDTTTNLSVGSANLAPTASTFSLNSAATPQIGNESQAIVVADLNGDGKPDVVVANTSSNSPLDTTLNNLTVLIGTADRTFAVAASPAITGLLAVGDFNRDGVLDLAVGTASYYSATAGGANTVTILLGNGDGTFKTGSVSPLNGPPGSIVVGDFNADGISDIAVADSQNSNVDVLLGNGDGSFSAVPVTPVTGSYPDGMTTADFNGDGKPDLAVATGGNFPDEPSGLTILLGNGDGTFTPKTSSYSVNGGYIISVLAADFNGDGKADLLTQVEGNGAGLTLDALLGNGDGTFQAAQSTATDGTYGYEVAVGDFNGDGKTDVAVAGEATVSIRLSNGDGTFSTAATAVGATSAPDSFLVAVGDFNGDGVPDLATANSDTQLANILLTQLSYATSAQVANVTVPGSGPHSVVATYGGDKAYQASTSNTASIMGQTFNPKISWVPTASTIVYGTQLGTQQLNATATGVGGIALQGKFTYTPPSGALLDAGPQTLSVQFAPTSLFYAAATATTTITVTKAMPTLRWPTPVSVAYGVPLGAAQLNAAATGVDGLALPGILVYSPANGAVLNPGVQTLSVAFSPTDTLDYVGNSTTVSLTVTDLTLVSITPNTAQIGDTAKTLTLSGSGFVSTTMALLNGTPVSTSYVNPTTLTAVIPASDFTAPATLQISLRNPTTGSLSRSLPVTVSAPPPSASLTGPTTTQPGTQTAVLFSLNTPYPVPLVITFNLSEKSALASGAVDPAVQFASGGTSYTATLPAGSTTLPPVDVQAGTIAGTITVPVTLIANGIDVTPGNLAPVVIEVPFAVPSLTTSSLMRSGKQLSVTVVGFSNTRDIVQADFHFTPIEGASLTSSDFTVPVSTAFGTWFSDPASLAYGSAFSYTQVFSVSDDASNIGSVQVTLTNSTGVSATRTAQ